MGEMSFLVFHHPMALLLLGGLIFLIYRTLRKGAATPAQRAQVDQEKPLSISQDAGWTVISAKAGALPRPGALRASLIMTMVFGVGGTVIGTGAGVGPMFGFVVLVGGLLFWALGSSRVEKQNRVAQPQAGAFAVRPDAVRTPAGAVIPAASVYRILIENRVTGQIVSSGSSALFAAPIGGGAMGATAFGLTAAGAGMVSALSQASGVKWRQKLQEMGYAVVAEHDGTRTVLASGMTSELAYAVLRETTSRVNGFH